LIIKNNIKTNFDTTTSSMAKFVTEKVDNSFLEMRLIEPGDYYKDYFLLLADLSDIDPTKITLQQFSRYIDNMHINYKQVWVIEDTRYKKIVCSMTILFEDKLIHTMSKVCHIEDLVIHHCVRLHGLGRAMIDHALQIAKEYDCYKLTLYCKDELIPFYEKCNLQKKGVEMAMYLVDLPPAEPTDDITITVDDDSDKTA
jgi:glucosamine-phosphate N-acetyltransferase